MKQPRLLIAVFLGIILNQGILHGATIPPSALPEEGHPILVTLAEGPIDLTAIMEFLHFGWTAPSSTVFSNQIQGNPRCTIQNTGDATIDYTVAASISGGWTMGTSLGDFGTDRCVVAAIFTGAVLPSEEAYPYGRELNYADFGDNDVLGPLPLQATMNVLARDNTAVDPDDPDVIKGFNVMPLFSTRSLRFMVETPSSDNTGIEQTINITIGAVVQ